MSNNTQSSAALTDALALEERKWQYRKEELIYQEAGLHLRSLNQHLWQVPGMAIAITGGMWYAAASLGHISAKIAILIFAALVCFTTIVVLWRIRSIISIQLKIQKRFANERKDKINRVVIICWSLLLLLAAALSIAGACNADDVSLSNAPAIETTTSQAADCTQLHLYIQSKDAPQAPTEQIQP